MTGTGKPSLESRVGDKVTAVTKSILEAADQREGARALRKSIDRGRQWVGEGLLHWKEQMMKNISMLGDGQGW